MTLHDNKTSDMANTLDQQIVELHQKGFKLKLDRGQDTTLVTVLLQRAGQNATEFKLVLLVDNAFPASAPQLSVLESGQQTDKWGQILDLPFEITSRQKWTPDSHLYQIVEEIGWLLDCPMPGDTGQSSPFPPPEETGRRPWRAVLLSTAVLAVAGLSLFFWQSRDTCAEDLALARTLRDSERVRALQIYEDLYRRGNGGEDGSCAALVADPAAMREAYMEHGQALFAAGDLVKAVEAYRRAEALGSPLARAGLDEIQRQLWTQANTLSEPTDQAAADKLISILAQIATLNPAARDPDGLPLAARQARAELSLGNLLYAKDDLAGAQAAYERVATQLGALPEKDRALEQVQALRQQVEANKAWITRREALPTLTKERTDELLAELERLTKDKPDLTDPAGVNLTTWRCRTLTSYGNLLNEQAEGQAAAVRAQVEDVRKQAEAALALCPEDSAALALQNAAEEKLRDTSSFQFDVDKAPDDGEFTATLARAGFAEPQQSSINLIIWPEASLTAVELTVQQADNTTVDPIPAANAGDKRIQAWALSPGEYRILIKRSENDYNTQDISVPTTGEQRFLVRILSSPNNGGQP